MDEDFQVLMREIGDLPSISDRDSLNSEDVEPITEAIIKNDYETFKKLADELTDINFVEKTCESPLITATEKGNLKMVKYLLEKGADPNFSNSLFCPLSQAVHNNHTKLVRLFLESGADPNITERNFMEYFSPLAVACHDSNFYMVILLIKYGAQIVTENVNCVFICLLTGALEIIRYFLSIGYDPNQSINVRLDNFDNLLNAAIACEHYSLARELIAIGVQPTLDKYDSPLKYTLAAGNYEMSMKLIEMGIRHESKFDQENPLMIEYTAIHIRSNFVGEQRVNLLRALDIELRDTDYSLSNMGSNVFMEKSIQGESAEEENLNGVSIIGKLFLMSVLAGLINEM